MEGGDNVGKAINTMGGGASILFADPSMARGGVEKPQPQH